MKNFTKTIAFAFLIFTFFAAWKEYNKTPVFYIFGNTNDYQFNIEEQYILDINNNVKTYYNDLDELAHQIEVLTYQQTTQSLQDSTYVLLSGDTCTIANYSDNNGITTLFQYSKMGIDQFQCPDNEDTSCVKTYLYFYNDL